MMTKGRWEVPITIGFLLSYYQFRINYNAIFGNTSDSTNFFPSWGLGDQPEGGTGRGGHPWDLNGDMGRLPAMELANLIEPVLCGAGGTLNAGGSGYQPGQLGFGGNGCISTTDPNMSPGGGGGLFGGGSGFVTAGAGGGSSAVVLVPELKFNESLFDYKRAPNITLGKTADLTGGLLYQQADGKNTASYLYQLNTEWMSYYRQFRGSDWSDKAWSDYVSIRQEAKGHGFIMISRPNEMIDIDKQLGWTGVGHVFFYTGAKMGLEMRFDKTASYHIICFGACGGSIGQWTPGFEYLAGGFGGCASGVFGIKAGTVLYGYIGEKGNSQKLYHAFNGGGAASAGCTGGGGATDIRFTNSPTAFRSRIIVAGGGGGIYGSGFSGGSTDDLYIPGYVDLNTISFKGGSLGLSKYKVNDQSIVRVSFGYTGSADVTPTDKVKVKIKIQNGNEGTLEKEVVLDNISQEVEFDLSEVYPEGTPTHQVTIEAEWDSEKDIVIKPGSVNITVDTKPRDNESCDFVKLPIILSLGEVVNIDDKLNYVVVSRESGGGGDKILSIDEAMSLYDEAEMLIKDIKKKYIKVLDSMTLAELLEREYSGDKPEYELVQLRAYEKYTVRDALNLLIQFVQSTERVLVDTVKLRDSAVLLKGV